MMARYYAYGMRIRPFGIGCQPKDCFYKRVDDKSGEYWDIILYGRKLDAVETDLYSLDYLGEWDE
jgi:hypothetical protein